MRSYGVISIYHKGVLLSNNLANLNPGNSITASIFEIGNSWTGSNYAGFLSNFRVVVGTAVYTSNFTPPTTSLEPIENTTLLTLQGQNIKDASSSAHTITPNGDAKATIVSSSFEFDGTNDYVVTSSNTDFLFGTEEFAIEWWEYFTGTSGSSDMGHIGVFQFGSGNNTAHIWTNAGSFTAYPGSWQSIAMSPISNQWAHYVATGTSGDIRFYQNGELKDTKTWDWSATSSTSNFAVGGTPGWAYGNYAMAGKISSVRVYKGKSLSTTEVLQNYNATKGRYA